MTVEMKQKYDKFPILVINQYFNWIFLFMYLKVFQLTLNANTFNLR